MPTATKRRKLATAVQRPSATKGIDAFARVSKTTPIGGAIAQKKYIDSIATISEKEQPTNARKRKVVEVEEGGAMHCHPISTTRREIKPLPQRRSNGSKRIPKTPQNPIANLSAASSVDTPTKGARNLLDRLFLSKPPSPSPLRDASKPLLDVGNKYSQDLPSELLDLMNLHASFLTALSIHYAHNGTHAPADLRNLCPDVARAWGKRSILLEDIRRTLGVLNANIPDENKDYRFSKLSLSDYGHGKICVEVRIGAGKAGRMARPVNEDLLNEIFANGLKKAWEGGNSELKEFIQGLPLEPITTCSSLTKMSPLLAKGQRRLEDLRAGIIVKKSAKENTQQPIELPNGTRPTLLERLRAKQLHQSTLPPPPSKADLERKAALGRIDEVVAVLSILSTSSSIGQSRISFTLPTVLGKLRDSFKTPMSKDEGSVCVRLLAGEIAPEWVKVVKMGKFEALVVNRDERPSEETIRERVKNAA